MWQDYTGIITGETGCGKTTQVLFLAKKRGKKTFQTVFLSRNSNPITYNEPAAIFLKKFFNHIIILRLRKKKF